MKKYCLPILLLFLAVGCSQPQSGKMPITSFDTDMVGSSDMLVDVRTPGEFGQGHLEGAVNIDWLAPDFKSKWEDIPKEGTIYLYCKVGGRSGEAARYLDSLGYTVVDLTGGWDAYQAAQKP